MIPLLDLVTQYQSIKPEIDAAIQDVLNSGKFILGPQEKAFEQEIADYLGVRHAVGLASGTDALIIALRAAGIGPGDEVIVPAYSFFATAGAVLSVGATPVFVDITPDTYLLDTRQLPEALTERTRAIIPVHLYGQAADMDGILAFARQHNLIVIEDNAQAFGAEYKGKKTGSLGDLGCLSFFPSKNLGGYGDGGMLVTNDDELAKQARMLRTHGWQKKYFPEILGYNSRLDELQAAILRVKLKYVDGWNAQRCQVASWYDQALTRDWHAAARACPRSNPGLPPLHGTLPESQPGAAGTQGRRHRLRYLLPAATASMPALRGIATSAKWITGIRASQQRITGTSPLF